MNYDELIRARLEQAVLGVWAAASDRRPPIERERPWNLEDDAELSEVCLEAETLGPVAKKLGLPRDATPDAVCWELVHAAASSARWAEEMADVPVDFLEPQSELTRALTQVADILDLATKLVRMMGTGPTIPPEELGRKLDQAAKRGTSDESAAEPSIPPYPRQG